MSEVRYYTTIIYPSHSLNILLPARELERLNSERKQPVLSTELVLKGSTLLSGNPMTIEIFDVNSIIAIASEPYKQGPFDDTWKPAAYVDRAAPTENDTHD